MEAILDKAFTEAEKLITHNKKSYNAYTYLHVPSQHGGDDFKVRSNTFDKTYSYMMLKHVIHKAKELLQSDHTVKLTDFKASFEFIKAPDGGPDM